ncbi:major facilitator superfamily transporter [Seiridium cupressi]
MNEVSEAATLTSTDHPTLTERSSRIATDNTTQARSAPAPITPGTAASERNAEPEIEDEIRYPAGLKSWIIILSLCLAVFLVALDQTIIAPALGAITAEYGSVKDIGWLFDIKLTFLGAVALFELGSLVSAVAPSSVAFIIGRAITGLGTAGLFSGAIVILSHKLPLRKRPIMFGLFGGMWGIASVTGPLLGGVFTDHATWRWCFYFNLPIGGVAMLVIFFFLSISKLDLLGATVLIPSIIMLLLALQWGGADYPWSDSRIIGLFVAAGVMAALFADVEYWQQDKGLLPDRFFKNRNVLSAMLFGLFFGACFFPTIFYLSLYFQAVQGDSTVQAGIKLLPMLLSTVLSSMISGALITIFGYYNGIILVESAMLTVGAGLITTFWLDTPFSKWFGYQVLFGLGTGVCFQAGVLVVQNVLPQELAPQGTACIQFFQSLGGVLFIAVAQTVFQNGLIEGIARDAPQINPLVFINSGASQIRQVLAAMVQVDAIDAVLGAYTTGLRNTYYISLGTAAAAFLTAFGLQWKKIDKFQTMGPKDDDNGKGNPEITDIDGKEKE